MVFSAVSYIVELIHSNMEPLPESPVLWSIMCLELWNKEDLGSESTTGEDRSIELT